MKIKENLERYKLENPDLFEYIDNLVNKKSGENKWDTGIEVGEPDLTKMLLFEYSTSLEKITKGKVSAKFVIEKLERQMGTFRFGDYKKGIDDNITYDKKSVTSEQYKKMCRINTSFGAHAPTYMEGNEEKCAIVLFDDKQQYIDSEGNEYILSGIDLNDLSDIRGTVFHEWTHVMEQSLVPTNNLKKEDIIYTYGSSKYINTMLSPDLSMEEYEDYIAGVDSLLESNTSVIFGGISTIEINNEKSPNRRIMHNQISEGATEYIARLVMAELGDTVKDPTRYANKVDVIRRIFESKGISNAVAMYVTSSKDIIRDLESRSVSGKDLLHYISEHVDFLGRAEESICREIYSSKKSGREIFSTVASNIVQFWGETPNASEKDRQKKLNEILDMIDVDLSPKSVKILKRVIDYPRIDREFKEVMKREFPKPGVTVGSSAGNKSVDDDEGTK